MVFLKNNFKILVIVLSTMILLVGGIFAIQVWENKNTFPPDLGYEDDKTINYNGKTYIYNKNIETFLVIGLDVLGEDVSDDIYRNDKRADFLVLFVFDNEKQICKAIQINRDTVTEMNILGVAGQKVGTITQQIALSHSYGNGREVSSRNTADAVANLLFDIKVNHYASITMEAVPVYNDFIGGVELEILDDFTGIDNSLIKGKIINLTGEQALTYIRSRQGLPNATNVKRMERQRQYMTALYKKTKDVSSGNDTFVAEAASKVADYFLSDTSTNRLETIFEKIKNYDFKGFVEIQGENKVVNNFMEFHPNKDSMKKIVVDLFYKEK